MMECMPKKAKFEEKLRFLGGDATENAKICVREWLKNAIGWARTERVFQKVTASVSLVKRTVRQNEMGLF